MIVLKQFIKVIWLTGLPCSGKTTLANRVQSRLGGQILDGDEIRNGLCNDLGFSKRDREENIRRVGEVARLISGLVIVALVSPYRQSRDAVRDKFGFGEFIEVWLDCSLEECKRRDVKHMYAKSSKPLTPVYEPPVSPEIHLETDVKNIDECTDLICAYVDIGCSY